MAKYNLTEEAKQDLMCIPADILPKNVVTQIKTFPIRSILDGIEKELEPEEIGNMVYKEIVGLQMDNYTDVGMRKSCDWAKFIQAEVQKRLKDIMV